VNVQLLYRDQDLDFQPELPPWQRPRNFPGPPPPTACEQALVQDLELNVLFNAMAGGDQYLFQVARRVILLGPQETLATVHYRQAVLQDCLRNEAAVRAIYQVAVDAIEKKQRGWFSILSHYPGSILSEAVRYLRLLTALLQQLRRLADAHAAAFESEGFQAFFSMIRQELTEEYLAQISGHLKELEFRDGVQMSAELDTGNEGTHYVLRKTPHPRLRWYQRLFARPPPAYTYRLDPRDERGARALWDMRDRGLRRVAVAAAQSAEHVAVFLLTLRTELAFYLGCANLHREMVRQGVPVCFPIPWPSGTHRYAAAGLRDVCLTLTMPKPVVGNDLQADGKELIIITGANQGGKSCFLRGLGLAQLMMQCGLFVSATAFQAELCCGLFTHYQREEDATMTSGKLDEELGRMSGIIAALRPDAMVLFNESFSSTNEREGSEIAWQIVGALLAVRVRVLFVTHLYDFARRCWAGPADGTLCLRAERQADGQRTFKLLPGEPLETSFGADLYAEVCGQPDRSGDAARCSGPALMAGSAGRDGVGGASESPLGLKTCNRTRPL